MSRQNTVRKLMDRFKPGIFERLKQSREAKAKKKDSPVITGQHIERMEVVERMSTLSSAATTSAVTSNNVTIWYDWNQTYTTANVWNEWNTNIHLNTTTAGTAETWVRWQTMGGQQGFVRTQGGLVAPPDRRIQVAESEEQKKLRAEQEARWRAEDAIRQQKYAEEQRLLLEAQARARKLLLSCLTPEQKASLEKLKFFYVTARSGRKYRIDEGTHGNVKVVDRDNRVIERLCIQPNGVPVGDSMLAQKLLIETAEDVFRQHANITLNDGRILYGSKELLDGDKLATVLPFRRAA